MTDSQHRSMEKIMLKALENQNILDAIEKRRQELKSKGVSVNR